MSLQVFRLNVSEETLVLAFAEVDTDSGYLGGKSFRTVQRDRILHRGSSGGNQGRGRREAN